VRDLRIPGGGFVLEIVTSLQTEAIIFYLIKYMTEFEAVANTIILCQLRQITSFDHRGGL
jgi:hypothetical protein